MFAAPIIVALSLFGGAPPRPAAPAGCVTPTQTGTYRVVAMKPDSSSARQAMLVLENIDGCLEASLITEDHGPAVINRVVISGDTLRGSVRTQSGNGAVELRFTPTAVTGSIVDGRQHWRVTGRRTS